MVRIVADSSVDVFKLEGVDFVSAPLSISTGKDIFTDDENLNLNEMMNVLAGHKGRSFTACPSIDTWLRCYEGADDIFVVTLTSGLSGTYASAVAAGKLYKESNPGARVHVFDTLSAGPSVRLTAEYIASKIKSGASFDDIIKETNAYMKATRVLIALESFNNFAQNGRVSRLAVKAAGLLGIRVMATASDKGTIEVIDKFRGEVKTVKGFLDNMTENGYRGGKVYISHCFKATLALEISNDIKKLYPNAEVVIYPARGLCSYYAERGGILLSYEL